MSPVENAILSAKSGNSELFQYRFEHGPHFPKNSINVTAYILLPKKYTSFAFVRLFVIPGILTF